MFHLSGLTWRTTPPVKYRAHLGVQFRILPPSQPERYLLGINAAMLPSNGLLFRSTAVDPWLLLSNSSTQPFIRAEVQHIRNRISKHKIKFKWNNQRITGLHSFCLSSPNLD